ncbi:cyclic peptide export ABC transporter [Thalassomonas actiniarum]|uniref:Cyclic peptide export ABC transporter n=1 Tax=Thalassomonas actiniarum TaxID=485447 RepID=A0AAF0C6I8_9GAMM|nr:cyclic peptide export ABC transporter [Thalassomonas actiniarum]WDE02115.1 cyclic peptide export ABC transporter [Thalassomonas actiniarum]
MKIFNSFTKEAPNKVFISILLGALAGMLYSALIPLVLSGINPEDPAFPKADTVTETLFSFDVSNYKLALMFLFSCVLILLMRSSSEVMLIRVSSNVAKDLRTKFYYRIAGAPLATQEKIGSARFTAAVNIDVPRIIGGARVIPEILINTITLVGMLGFLVYLNFEVFKFVMMAIFIGVICYQIPITIGSRMFQTSRIEQDKLQESIKSLIYGAKELKLDTLKRQHFFKHTLLNHEDNILKNNKRAETIMRATMCFGDLISFFVIGAVCFIFVNYYSISQQELVGVVMALLYVTGPISIILGSIPQLAIASVSYRRMEKLIAEIPQEDSNEQVNQLGEWQSMRFNQIEYSYPMVSGEAGFKVGPLNLEINKGEITFIIGANGSGKSTLSKLLTLHYLPTSGDILFGDQRVSADSIVSHRQTIGAIYSDYHLFDRLLVELTDEVLATTQHYLKTLHLDKKVKIVDGQFSTTSLSDGQRKRLALLVAFLEDKDLYLFDEWAADQDPVFKNVFYTEILPNLKAKNKAVIAISHDDKYFDVADKILVMDQGKLVDYEESSLHLAQVS